MKQPPQFVASITDHPEQVHNFSVQIVINFAIASRFLDEDRASSTKRLRINSMPMEMPNDPLSEQPLPAVIPENWPGNN